MSHSWERIGLGHLHCVRCDLTRLAIHVAGTTVIAYTRRGHEAKSTDPCADPSSQPDRTING